MEVDNTPRLNTSLFSDSEPALALGSALSDTFLTLLADAGIYVTNETVRPVSRGYLSTKLEKTKTNVTAGFFLETI
jgi:hypothetical protein